MEYYKYISLVLTVRNGTLWLSFGHLLCVIFCERQIFVVGDVKFTRSVEIFLGSLVVPLFHAVQGHRFKVNVELISE